MQGEVGAGIDNHYPHVTKAAVIAIAADGDVPAAVNRQRACSGGGHDVGQGRAEINRPAHAEGDGVVVESTVGGIDGFAQGTVAGIARTIIHIIETVDRVSRRIRGPDGTERGQYEGDEQHCIQRTDKSVFHGYLQF
ncbi:MAG TPA: hypothetical protein VNK49_06155 [Anaerolineales bacterium]|nr:hypothetical protein [Anaerolineales bacterium]